MFCTPGSMEHHLRAWVHDGGSSFRSSRGASGLLLYSRRPVCPKFHFLNKILAKSLDRVLLGLFHLSCRSWGCRDLSPTTSGLPVRAVLSPQGWAVPISRVSPSVIPRPRSPKPAVGDHAMQTFSGMGSASVGGCYRESLIWSEVGLLKKCPDPPCGQPSPTRAARHGDGAALARSRLLPLQPPCLQCQYVTAHPHKGRDWPSWSLLSAGGQWGPQDLGAVSPARWDPSLPLP